MACIIRNVVIPDELLNLQFSCLLHQCKGACCRSGEAGAPASRDEIIRIEQFLDSILPHLSINVQNFIRTSSITDTASKGYLRIALFPGSNDCIFCNDENGSCTCWLQILHEHNQLPLLKPISCRLFPIREIRVNGLVHLTLEFYDECVSSLRQGRLLVQSCREALISRFGHDFITQLDLYLKRVSCNEEENRFDH